jgi:hypothetical protein
MLYDFSIVYFLSEMLLNSIKKSTWINFNDSLLVRHQHKHKILIITDTKCLNFKTENHKLNIY